MKLIVLCLFAVFCYTLASTKKIQQRKLEETLRELDAVNKSLKPRDKMLNSPPENIEDCCSLPALKCFEHSLREHFDSDEKKMKKFIRSLGSKMTEQALNFCNRRNNSSTCPDCNSQPRVNVEEFFNRLRSLLQRGISRYEN